MAIVLFVPHVPKVAQVAEHMSRSGNSYKMTRNAISPYTKLFKVVKQISGSIFVLICGSAT